MHDIVRTFEAEILRLKWHTALANLETAVRRCALAERRQLASKAGFRPDQLRVPAGSPDGGQWMDEGQDADVRVWLASSEKVRAARDLMRKRGLRSLERVLEEIGKIDEELRESALSSADPPKSLEELQRAAKDARPGYDVRHIVERHTAARDGSEDHLINAPENLVRIPRWGIGI
jgi:hypothetical protein